MTLKPFDRRLDFSGENLAGVDAVAYLLPGRLTECRGPALGPVVLQAGEAAFETTGVTHWWRNETSEQVRALFVDIIEASTP